MTGRAERHAPETTYVLGPVWHIVDGPGADGPRVGAIYPFRCYRWIRVSDADERGLWRGAPPPDAPVCHDCLTFGAGLDGAVDGPGDDSPL